MQEYQRITEQSIETLRPFFQTYACGVCDNTVGAVYQWRDIYVSYFAVIGNMLCIRAGYGVYGDCYTVPLGAGDFDAACEANEKDAQARGIPLRYCVVPACAVARLRMRYGSRMQVESIRDWADYIYHADAFRTYAGKALHTQKNHVNRFYRDHPDAQTVVVRDAQTEAACLAFLDRFREKHPEFTPLEQNEWNGAKDLLLHREKLGQTAACLVTGGEVVALAIGEAKDDMLYVHVEKAMPDVSGAYPAMAQAFVKCFDGVQYVNREDDGGDAGLRYSKLNYKPVELREKYLVTIRDDATYEIRKEQTMNKPILLIMAAGMGSRFGGPKQIEPIDEHDHVILDFSVFDAIRAGFEKVVVIIKKEMEADFEERVGRRIRPHVQLEYAFQSLDKLPEGYAIPEGRVKPWGTAHAILCAKDLIDAPFAVLNADDFYGADAYRKIYAFLKEERPESECAMVGYQLGNTLSDFGSVARGVCEVGADGKLQSLTERLKIEKRDGAAAFTEDDGQTYTPLALDTLVSMNLFGLQKTVLDAFEARFPAFLDENLPKNPMKCEYLLPRVLDAMMQEGKITIEVLETSARWHGVTNRPDLPILKAAIRKMKDEGQYPEELWK
jgi:hypothetical protein